MNEKDNTKEFIINIAKKEWDKQYIKRWTQEFIYDYGRVPYSYEKINWKAYDRYNNGER